MASLNQWIAKQQKRTLMASVAVIVLVLGVGILLVPKAKKPVKEAATLNLTGIVDESFSEANAESALTAQQAELESLKQQMQELKNVMVNHDKESAQTLSTLVAEKLKETQLVSLAQNNNPTTDASSAWQGSQLKPKVAPKLHSVSFRYGSKTLRSDNRLSPAHYVPSGTFVRAVVLGGADADASVNGQSKNNGVMLFKLLQPGTLPNGQRSHLQGCFVTASSYGDISSERAYVILDRISCAQPGQSIIDKAVTGWAFFGGKVGIKGVPLMRDNKIMQWAGISGAMSGIASAAQYAQSVQSINPLGSAITVPSTSVAPYAAYGGASKAAEVLSNYYVKRAEQYHPVIQVGSGNLVTIVFKDGFFLEPDEALRAKPRTTHAQSFSPTESSNEDFNDITVPSQIMDKVNASRGVER
ncbi:MAG: TrbI/VirB10 family protein [Legionellaceae bacterium]|nr:TrbI/VirB10 family protein [Legionellaceae bacterium]